MMFCGVLFAPARKFHQPSYFTRKSWYTSRWLHARNCKLNKHARSIVFLQACISVCKIIFSQAFWLNKKIEWILIVHTCTHKPLLRNRNWRCVPMQVKVCSSVHSFFGQLCLVLAFFTGVFLPYTRSKAAKVRASSPKLDIFQVCIFQNRNCACLYKHIEHACLSSSCVYGSNRGCPEATIGCSGPRDGEIR